MKGNLKKAFLDIWKRLCFHYCGKIAGLSLILTCGSCTSYAKGAPMISHVPDSQSEVLSASSIFTVEILDAKIPAQPEKRAFDLPLKLRLTEIIKGKLKANVGYSFDTIVAQYHGPIGMSLPAEAAGIWPLQTLEKGQRWTIFCNTGDEKAPLDELLKGHAPDCGHIYPQEGIAVDLQLVSQNESKKQPLKEFLEKAAADKGKLTRIFAAYLWVKSENIALKDNAVLEDVLKFLESEGLSPVCQSMLFGEIYDYFSERDGSSELSNDKIDRFIVSSFRLLKTSKEDKLVGTFIPTFLGIRPGMKKKPASRVFKNFPEDKKISAELLKAHPLKSEAKVLLDWIDNSGAYSKGGKMTDFYNKISNNSKDISPADVAFVDKSFKAHGKNKNSAFGDYSSGLEEIGKETLINITRKNGNFFIELVDRNHLWDFSVTIDGKTGKWENPVQGIIAPPPK